MKPMNRGMRQRVKAPKGVMKKLINLLFQSYKKRLIIVFIAIIFTAVFASSSAIFLQLVIDKVVTPGLENGFDSVVSTLVTILICMLSIGVLNGLTSFTYNRIMATVTQSFLYDLRVKLFAKMEKLPIKYFDQTQHGDIMSTFTNDIDALRQFISQTLINLISTGVTIIYLIIMMLFYSLWLTLVVFMGVVTSVLITKKISGKMGKYFMQQQKSIGKVEGYVEEMMEGQRVVKVFNYEHKAKEKFDQLNKQLCLDAKNANAHANVLMPILGNLGNVFYIIVLLAGALLVSYEVYNVSIGSLFTGENKLLVGMVLAFLPMSKQFTQSIAQISQQLPMYGMAMAGTHRIIQLLEADEEFDDGYVTLVKGTLDKDNNFTVSNEPNAKYYWKHPHRSFEGTTYHEVLGEIILEDVDFCYEEGKNVLNDVTVYANPGEKIALVGSTGAGKTTITNLINRFYDIADGKVKYDGININKIRKSDLRRSLGFVLQDTNLFTGTVAENIKYGAPDATEEEIITAAKLANAYDFITRLPDGFNTLLENNGENLSQGQRQLISIARASCANTPVMILDEATSSIDTRTEKLVQSGMDKLMHGRTVFVIAHRLSTVRNSDCIMVLEKGRVIEKGTHESLIKNKKTYYSLYTGDFEME